MTQDEVEVLEGQPCPFCQTNNLTLMERVLDIPYFGITHIFSMDCQNCEYFMSDVESEEDRKPVKQSFSVESEDDLKVRIVKSAAATVKIPRMVSVEPGSASNGYVTNVEGLLNRVKKVLEEQKQDDDKAVAKKAKSHLKRLQRALWGQDSLTIQLIDKTGNSAILSEKAK